MARGAYHAVGNGWVVFRPLIGEYTLLVKFCGNPLFAHAHARSLERRVFHR